LILSYFDAIILYKINYSLNDTWKGVFSMTNIELEKISIKIESIAALLAVYSENHKGGIRGESTAIGLLADQLYECADKLDQMCTASAEGE